MDQLTFTSSQTTDCARLLIADDDFDEGTEMVILSLHSDESFVVFDDAVATITILDNDGECKNGCTTATVSSGMCSGVIGVHSKSITRYS